MYQIICEESDCFKYEWFVYDKDSFNNLYREYETRDNAQKYFNNMIKKFILGNNCLKNIWILFIANGKIENKIFINNKM